jgi:hypothetical protein
MHLEILIEDSSGEKLLQSLLPMILGRNGDPHTWRLHAYKGVGRIPKDLPAGVDAAKRMLLDNLPKLLSGYGRTPGVDAVVVILDTDRRDCREFLAELLALAQRCEPAPNTLFRLAIEEMEAWYFGDKAAILQAYPPGEEGNPKSLPAGHGMRHMGNAGGRDSSGWLGSDQKSRLASFRPNQTRMGREDWPSNGTR